MRFEPTTTIKNLVTIIMPVYNGEPTLQEAVDSVLSQSYPDWELIVVDDGSTDTTADIVMGFRDSRIRYFYQENRGQAAALNRGLENSQGEFVTTLDADDWLTQNSLADRVAFLNEHPEFGVVYADGYYCDPSGKELMRFSEYMPARIEGDVFGTLLVTSFYGTGATVMIRREVADHDAIRYDESIVWCQDWDFYIRLAEKTQFGYSSSIAIRYRLHSSGMTVSMPEGRRLESLIRLRYKALSLERFATLSPQQKQAFFYDFLVKDLKGRVEAQQGIIDRAEFASLSGHSQAQLLRQIAIPYLTELDRPDLAVKWLRSAWKRSPTDLKTIVVIILTVLRPSIAKSVVHNWQGRNQEEFVRSPFDLAIVPNSEVRE